MDSGKYFGAAAPPGGLDLEVGDGSSISLDAEGGDKGVATSEGSADVKDRAGLVVEIKEIEKSILKLTLKDGPPVKHAKAMTGLISKLGEERKLLEDEKRLAKKAAWIAETRMEVQKRKEFQEKEILVNWEGSSDKARITRMSLLCRNLLKGQRTAFLFHEVLPLLLEGGEGHSPSKGDVLTCRRTCREWNESIKHFDQNLPAGDYFPEIPSMELVGPTLDLLPVTFKWDRDLVTRFRDWSSLSCPAGSNPFFSRKLWLGYHSTIVGLRIPEFWNEVEHLLENWGGEIWQVNVILNGGLRLLEMYDEVVRFLKLMPNLRIVKLSGRKSFLHPIITRLLNEVTKSDLGQELGTRMVENPLPELPHLTTLVVDTIPSQIINGMVKKFGSTLVNVVVDGGLQDMNPNDCTGELHLGRLRQLSFSAQELNLEESKFLGDWPIIEELSLIDFTVKEAKVPMLFQSLSRSRFGGTLRKLVLSLHKWEEALTKLKDREIKMLSLDLPQVEEFHLSVSRVNLKTIDFILPMKSLKELKVSYIKEVHRLEKKGQSEAGKGASSKSTPASGASGEVINFGSYTNRLYVSNIWTLFPALNKVTIVVVNKLKKKLNAYGEYEEEGEAPRTVKRKQYNREGYKQHCKLVADDAAGNGE